ncbi:MAG: DUF3883 domain-containing protein [Chloroflexi bacterium]|nr:DUF3883 domain-containing protein [Chloroflexota bacterium]
MLASIIKSISEEFLQEAIGSPRLFEDMAAMEKHLAESYSSRVFIELLQNADDAGAQRICVLFVNNSLFVANDGRPFSETDVISICRSGASSKKRGETIGYRGVGFKSTSYLSQEIIIYSNKTYFTFSKLKCSNALERPLDKIPTIRIPFILDQIDDSLRFTIERLENHGFNTIFIYKNAKSREFFEEIKELSSDTFLFLNNIKKCEIDTNVLQKTILVQRSKYLNYPLISFSEKDMWIVFRGNTESIAFKFDGNCIIPAKEEESIYHCYLPTMDKTSLPLKINGDFTTDPSRKHITLDQVTEKALDAAADIIFSIIKSSINRSCSEVLRNIFTILIKDESYSRINMLFSNKLRQKIESDKFILLQSGESVFLKQYRILPDWLEESEKLLLRQNSKYVNSISLPSEFYSFYPDIDIFFKKYSVSEFTISDFITIMSDPQFVSKLNRKTQGKILGNVIAKMKADQQIFGKEYYLSDICISNKYETQTIDMIASRFDFLFEKDFLDSVAEQASFREITWFCDQTGINKERLIIKEILTNDKKSSDFSRKNVSLTPTVPKWRSAEQKCMEIERMLGFFAEDVSKRNIGYDIESIGPDGSKRFIEVKALDRQGSPFSMTNNEYTAAHQLAENYYICLISENGDKLNAIYIKNPLTTLYLEKRCRSWEWFCDSYEGEQYSINLS